MKKKNKKQKSINATTKFVSAVLDNNNTMAIKTLEKILKDKCAKKIADTIKK